jgi:Xaa-Pro aminopeptidase
MFNREGLLRSLRDHELDAVVLASPANIVYTTGVDLYTQLLIPERLVLHLITAGGESTVITFERERTKFSSESWVKDVRGFAEFGASPVSVLAAALAEKGLNRGRIGIEKAYLPVGAYQELGRLAPGVSLVGCDALLARVRAIKTTGEIAHLKAVARAMDRAIHLAAGLTRPGDTETTLACRIVSNLMTVAEGDVGTIDALVASGPNLAIAHNTYGNRSMESGDLVRFGCKARFKGYWCLLLRTGVCGEAAPAQKAGYARYAEAFHNSIQGLRPGLRACDAFNRCKCEVERHGLTMVSEKIGHSTGLVFRDAPVLQALDERPLQANMVLAHDFLAYDEPGQRYFVEDRVLITETGAELLSDVSDTRVLAVLGQGDNSMRGALHSGGRHEA